MLTEQELDDLCEFVYPGGHVECTHAVWNKLIAQARLAVEYERDHRAILIQMTNGLDVERYDAGRWIAYSAIASDDVTVEAVNPRDALLVWAEKNQAKGTSDA